MIKRAKDAGGEIIAGGSGDDSKGWFVKPTVVVTKDPKSVSMVEEIFGPVMTVSLISDFLDGRVLRYGTGRWGKC